MQCALQPPLPTLMAHSARPAALPAQLACIPCHAMQVSGPTSSSIALMDQGIRPVLGLVAGDRKMGCHGPAWRAGSKGLHEGVPRHEGPGLCARPVLLLVLGRGDLRSEPRLLGRALQACSSSMSCSSASLALVHLAAWVDAEQASHHACLDGLLATRRACMLEREHIHPEH